jgi:hypothetical protein
MQLSDAASRLAKRNVIRDAAAWGAYTAGVLDRLNPIDAQKMLEDLIHLVTSDRQLLLAEDITDMALIPVTGCRCSPVLSN